MRPPSADSPWKRAGRRLDRGRRKVEDGLPGLETGHTLTVEGGSVCRAAAFGSLPMG